MKVEFLARTDRASLELYDSHISETESHWLVAALERQPGDEGVSVSGSKSGF